MSEPTTEPTPTNEPTADPEPKVDLAAELQKAQGKLEKSVQAEKNLRDRLKAIEESISGKVQAAEQSAEEKFAALLKQMQDQVSTVSTRAIKAEVKAVAAESLADPSDAYRFLDISKYATDGGDVDSDAIKSDLAELVKTKPYLAKSTGPKGPQPNPAQGSSGSTPPGKSQLSQEDLKRMSPEQIEKARLDGRLNDLMGIK